jgi:uncharacterized protein (TIGR02271 family)
MNSTTTGIVAAYFSTETEAEDAIRDLQTAGFSSNQIGLALASSRLDSRDPSSVNTAPASSTARTQHTGDVSSKAHAKAEGAWERFKEFFTGGDIEPYADERDRGSATAGEITGPGATTSTQTGDRDQSSSGQYGHDDVTGSLLGLGIPENRARYLANKLRSGSHGAIVTVNAGPRRGEAEEILTSRGGDLGAKITSQDDAATDYTGNQASAGAGGLAEQQRIELLGEVLRIHKERIQRGEVRIRKEVIVEQQTVQVPVSREEIVVERVPANENTPARGEIGSNQELRVPLTEERATLDKQTVVREQVNVGKRAVEEVENLQDSVRREELNVADSTTNPTRR